MYENNQVHCMGRKFKLKFEILRNFKLYTFKLAMFYCSTQAPLF
jgi:hypothetical protein